MQQYHTTQEELRQQELAHDVGTAAVIGLFALLIVGAIVATLLILRSRRKRFETADAEHAFGKLLELRVAMPDIWGVSPTPVEQATRTLLTKEGVPVMVLRIRAGNEHVRMMGVLDRWISYLSHMEGQLVERVRLAMKGRS